MFNYWTEGGFIAWGQEPDPNTGRTPLRLFMDGRAQAAYDRKAYNTWTEIMAGGYIAQERVKAAKLRGQELEDADYAEIGKWIDEQLKSRDVWITLMPANQSDVPFGDALEQMKNWQIVYFDNEQRITIDVEQDNGRRLWEKLSRGEVKYPDEFSRCLMLSRTARLFGKDKDAIENGFNAAVTAFAAKPSLAPARELVGYWRYTETRRRVTELFENYIRNIIDNSTALTKQHGHLNRLTAAMLIASYMQSISANGDDDAQGSKHYAGLARKFDADRNELLLKKRW
jgi:hypothetical protein